MSQKKAYQISSREENVQHGDIFLPVNKYTCHIHKSYREIGLHWHKEMEVTFIKQGISKYLVHPHNFHAKKGDILIVPPFVLHAAEEIPGKIMISESLVFHLDFLGAKEPDDSAAKYLRPIVEGQHILTPVIHCEDNGYKEIRKTFLEAMECFQKKAAFYELRLKELLLHFIYLLYKYGYIRLGESGENGGKRREIMNSLLSYISENYHEKISISELARISGFSESHFMSFFKENVGMTCIQYINHYRIQKAAHKLEDMLITDIAFECGFNNVSYFNLQFKQKFGMTPLQFRKKHNVSSVCSPHLSPYR